MSIRCVKPATELVAVVREVVAEIRRAAVAANEHTVALVAEVGGAQPAGAVVLVDEALRGQLREHVGDLAALVQRALGEPRVEVHTDAREVVLQALHDEAVAPLGRIVGRDVVTELGVQLRRHVDEVLALVPVLGRLDAAVPRVERVAELVELGAGIVQVVLAVHLRALRREQVRDRVAHRDPATTARRAAARSGWPRRTRD